jgi:hypothetical protein
LNDGETVGRVTVDEEHVSEGWIVNVLVRYRATFLGAPVTGPFHDSSRPRVGGDTQQLAIDQRACYLSVEVYARKADQTYPQWRTWIFKRSPRSPHTLTPPMPLHPRAHPMPHFSNPGGRHCNKPWAALAHAHINARDPGKHHTSKRGLAIQRQRNIRR